MKKGFTLSELVGVVVLLAALLLIIIPTVSKILKDGKDKMLESQITSIEQSLATWSIDHKPNVGETIYLTLSQLKKEGLVATDVKNPITNDYLANDMILTITNTDGIISYDVLIETGKCFADYKDIPKIEIQGDVVEYVELNSIYEDVKAKAIDKDGNLLNNVTSNSNLDTTKKGSYYITYNINKDGYCNSSIKTIIVKDTQAPEISFNGDLKIRYTDINTYDFLSDVTVTDNSKEVPNVSVEANFSAILGDYSIKYIVTDSSGNVTTKIRKVTIY